MSIRKRLGALAFASAVGLAGCADNPEYHYNGKIGEEQVNFYETELGEYNILIVTKSDGSKAEYYDILSNDFKLDYVDFTVGKNTTSYSAGSKNPEVQAVVKKAQARFDWYLKKITEIQTARFLREDRE